MREVLIFSLCALASTRMISEDGVDESGWDPEYREYRDMARNNVTDTREKRVFSLFSVVQFPNMECATQDTTSAKGVCVTSDECTSGSGTASGNCAAGFGVCCIFKSSTCGSTVSRNLTYIQNPGFPSTYTTTGSCTFKVAKADSSVCQLRLDFASFVLAGNTLASGVAGCCGSTCGTAGAKAIDSFTATGQSGKNPPSICHTNTDYHMYVETGKDSGDTVDLDFYLSDSGDTTTSLGAKLRKWNVKVTQIKCESGQMAPTDCVQYYMGTQGYVQNYGFASGQLLSSQNYQVCVRQELGYCGIAWHPSSSTTPSSFKMQGAAIGGTAESSIAGCTANYVRIPGAVAYGNALTFDGFCGEALSTDAKTVDIGPVQSRRTPFVLEVFSDATTAKVTTAVAAVPSPPAPAIPSVAASGFQLVYKQLPC